LKALSEMYDLLQFLSKLDYYYLLHHYPLAVLCLL